MKCRPRAVPRGVLRIWPYASDHVKAKLPSWESAAGMKICKLLHEILRGAEIQSASPGTP